MMSSSLGNEQHAPPAGEGGFGVMHRDPKRLVTDFYEGWARGAIDFEALVDADIVNHQPDVEPARGRDLFTAAIEGVMAVVPDSRWDVLDLLADGDRVAVRVTWSGTFQGGRFRGFEISVPGPFSVEQIHIYRVAEGKLAEHWVVRDDLAMLVQLDAVGS